MINKQRRRTLNLFFDRPISEAGAQKLELHFLDSLCWREMT